MVLHVGIPEGVIFISVLPAGKVTLVMRVSLNIQCIHAIISSQYMILPHYSNLMRYLIGYRQSRVRAIKIPISMSSSYVSSYPILSHVKFQFVRMINLENGHTM